DGQAGVFGNARAGCVFEQAGDHVQALVEGEHLALFGVDADGDDDLVKEHDAAAYNVEVAVGDRVELPGENGDAMDVVCGHGRENKDTAGKGKSSRGSRRVEFLLDRGWAGGQPSEEPAFLDLAHLDGVNLNPSDNWSFSPKGFAPPLGGHMPPVTQQGSRAGLITAVV